MMHKDFKLNGEVHSKASLLELAHKWIVEKQEEYLVDLGQLIVDWYNDSKTIALTTSGTTGPPKKILLKKTAMLASARATGDYFNQLAGTRALLCMSTRFVGGKLMLIRALVLGWQLDVVKPTANPLSGNKRFYDFVAMVPMQVEHSIDELHLVKTLIIGGAKVGRELRSRLLPLKTLVYETYGMTETITHIAAKRIGTDIFTALPHATFAIDDRECLVIDAPTVAEELVVTNDLVTLLDEQSFIWRGRVDNVINSGGVKLHPEEIEEKLAGLFSNRFFVTGVEDAYLGTKLVLVIEGEPFAVSADTFKLLGKFEKPKEIRFIPKFVETESGKVIRSKSLD